MHAKRERERECENKRAERRSGLCTVKMYQSKPLAESQGGLIKSRVSAIMPGHTLQSRTAGHAQGQTHTLFITLLVRSQAMPGGMCYVCVCM